MYETALDRRHAVCGRQWTRAELSGISLWTPKWLDSGGFRAELHGDDRLRRAHDRGTGQPVGPFRDVRAQRQRRTAAQSGSLIKLAPQPLKVLIWLSMHAGQLVTRQELRERTWEPGTFVDFEQGLNHCIKQIRLALGDDADSPRFIETIPKRGYRFIAEVHVDDARASTPARLRSGRRLTRLRAPQGHEVVPEKY